MFQIASFKIICADSTEILFSQILSNFFSKLGSAGLNYHLPKPKFFHWPLLWGGGVSNKHCLLTFFVIFTRVRFTLVSEPPEDDQDGECEDVGYAFVSVRDILRNRKDIVEEDIDSKWFI